jgi:hypothetical protein
MSVTKGVALITAISDQMHDLSIPNDPRTNLAARCHFTAMEHHAGIALLFSVGHPAPALTLLRPVFEAYVRGIWLSDCASDAQIADFQSRDWRKIPKIKTMVLSIERTTTFIDTGTLGKSLSANWETLCGFTHTGIEQLQMCLSNDAIERSCSDEQIDEASNFASACAIMAGIATATLAGNDLAALQILEIGKSFVDG